MNFDSRTRGIRNGNLFSPSTYAMTKDCNVECGSQLVCPTKRSRNCDKLAIIGLLIEVEQIFIFQSGELNKEICIVIFFNQRIQDYLIFSNTAWKNWIPAISKQQFKAKAEFRGNVLSRRIFEIRTFSESSSFKCSLDPDKIAESEFNYKYHSLAKWNLRADLIFIPIAFIRVRKLPNESTHY